MVDGRATLMKENTRSFTALIALLTTVGAANTFAETLSEAKDRAALATAQLAAAKAQAEATKINTGSRAKFTSSAQLGWAWIQAQCNGSISDQCAAAAVSMASNECSASAKFLKKDAKSWEYLNIGLLIAYATFTGIGASPTLANAKIWSTLGGTTGLGAVTSTVNSNVSSDQIGLISINTALNDFIMFVTMGATKGVSAPALVTAPSASGTVGTAFSYQIVATNSATSYLVTGLPAGLSANAATGLISGTPTAAGPSTLTIAATNANGTGNATMALAIAAAAVAANPVITSLASASGTVGSQFAYQIAATNSPTTYNATGLPTGLSVSATGLISGTPTSAGGSTVTLGATNANGTASATMMLTIATATPPGNGPAPNELVYKVASLYATRCAAAAMASSTK